MNTLADGNEKMRWIPDFPQVVFEKRLETSGQMIQTKNGRKSNLRTKKEDLDQIIIEDTTTRLERIPVHLFGLSRASTLPQYETTFRKVFGLFGKIRRLDIAIHDEKQFVARQQRKANVARQIQQKKMNKAAKKKDAVRDLQQKTSSSVEMSGSILDFFFDTNEELDDVEEKNQTSIDHLDRPHTQTQNAVSTTKHTSQATLKDPDLFIDLYLQYSVVSLKDFDHILDQIRKYQFLSIDSLQVVPIYAYKDKSGYFQEKKCRQRRVSARIEQDQEQFRKLTMTAEKKHRQGKELEKLNHCIANLEDIARQLDAVHTSLEDTPKLMQDPRYIRRLCDEKASIQDAIKFSKTKTKSLHELPCIEMSSKQAIQKAKKVIQSMKRDIRDINMALPSVYQVIQDLSASFFLRLCHEKYGQREPEHHGLRQRTLLVPANDAFNQSMTNSFEAECWFAHVLGGAYRIEDLARIDHGYVQTLDKHTILRVGLSPKGQYQIWIHGDSDPPMKAQVRQSNIVCGNGIIVHYVDRILYPIRSSFEDLDELDDDPSDYYR